MFLQLTVSAPLAAEAKEICDALLMQKLIAGGMITSGSSRYWWDGEVVERTYWNLNAYTVDAQKEKIISIVKKISSDECPVITFAQIDGSPDILNWIAENAPGNDHGNP